MSTVYEQRLAEIAESTVTAAVWDPLLHPRARNGQFIKVGGWVRGLFKVGGDFQQLNGKVLGIEHNKRYPKDPLVRVETKHGELVAPVSQISEAAKPKGKLTEIVEKVTGKEDAELAEYQKMSLDGDVAFRSGWPLEGRDINGIPLTEAPMFDPRSIPDVDVGEPELPDAGKFLKQSAGVLIEEPDGRVWLYEPANHFGGYKHTFSKGRVEDEDTVQQAALREAYEELGLVAEITGFVGDYKGTATMTRLYRGKRIGGAPWKHDNEVAEVRLVSPETATTLLNTERDQQILSDLTGDESYINTWLEAHPKWVPKKGGWKPQKPTTPFDFDEEDDFFSALDLTKKYGTSKLFVGAQVEVATPDGPVSGKVTRLSNGAVEVNTGSDIIATDVTQVTAVPMTEAELAAAKAEFQLRFLRARSTFQKVLNANNVGAPITLNDLTSSSMMNSGDGLPTDFMYDVEAASTAVGKVLDDEIERRVVVYAGDKLLSTWEFDHIKAELKKQIHAAVEAAHAKDKELSQAGVEGDLLLNDPEAKALRAKATELGKHLVALNDNRQRHRRAYAHFTNEVLSEVVEGGIGGPIEFEVFNPDPNTEPAKMTTEEMLKIINGQAPMKKLSDTDIEYLKDRVQDVVGSVYPSTWLNVSNVFSQPASVKLDPSRSWYDFTNGHMRLPAAVDTPYFAQVAVHEFGHRMEHVIPAIRRLEYAFYWRRQGKQLVPLVSMNQLQKGNYGAHEMARPDEFTNPYMGKDYSEHQVGSYNSFWELFTSGVERLLPDEQQKGVPGTNGLMAQDDDYRAWTLGVLVNAPPPKGFEATAPAGSTEVV